MTPAQLRLMQQYVVNIGVSATTVRGQGTGTLKAVREFLYKALNLDTLSREKVQAYAEWLDDITEKLRASLPESGGRWWGTARKAVNVVMVQAFLNFELSTAYDLRRFGDALETPLDQLAVDELTRLARLRGVALVQWPGVKYNTPKINGEYQEIGLRIAQDEGINRAHMDALLWRPDQVGKTEPRFTDQDE